MFNFSGGMLTGAEIEKQIDKGRINISPYDPRQMNPNSYNLKLHPQLLVYKRGSDRSKLISSYRPGVITEPANLYNNQTDGINNGAFINEIDNKIATLEAGVMNHFDKLKSYPTIDSLCLDPLDMKTANETIEFTIPEEGYVLQPGVLYIGRTVERTSSNFYIPMINGRSSGGRLGISIHICAGFGDVGFDGTWTLEITCVEPIRIYPYTEIAQVCYFKPVGKIGKLYRGRYFGQLDATASKFYRPKEDY